MDWVHVESDQVAGSIAKRLTELLETKSVTWFVSGGSNINAQVQTLHTIATHERISQLTILLIDERFGPVGHQDSNWQQLTEAGFIIDGPRYIAPFTAQEISLEIAAQRYENIINQQLNDTYCFAQLGMGEDGHISGILPNSAATRTSDHLVTGYEQTPHQRLTTTFKALKMLDEVALVSYGEAKWPQLAKLGHEISPLEQPVQIIKYIPQVTIYTDYQAGNS